MEINICVPYLHKSHDISLLPHCLRFLLEHEDVPREIEINAYANFTFFLGGGGERERKRFIMGFVQVENRSPKRN